MKKNRYVSDHKFMVIKFLLIMFSSIYIIHKSNMNVESNFPDFNIAEISTHEIICF